MNDSNEVTEKEEDNNVVPTEVGIAETVIYNCEKEGDCGDGLNQDLEQLERELAQIDEENGGGGDSSDDDKEEEEEEEFVLFYGKDPCTDCPKCSTELGHRDLTINIRTGVTTVHCDNNQCHARIVVMNLLLDRKKTNVPCGL